MSLTLYFHPLSSYCHKVLIAFYENDTPFEPHFLNLGDEAVRASFASLWPIGKMPVLRDHAHNRTIPESSIIIEHLTRHYPGPTRFIPDNADVALEARLWDRFFDLHMQNHMQKIVTDRLRPPGQGDAYGVEQAKSALRTAYDVLDRHLQGRTWAIGEAFTLADCAAAPALFYSNMLLPFGDTHLNAARYLDRLMERRSYARVMEEAQPYLSLVPQERGAVAT